MTYPRRGMTIAMLRQLMPSESSPPSPKKSAWMTRAAVTASTATQGPAITAIKHRPDGVGRRTSQDGDVQHHDKEAESSARRQHGDHLGLGEELLGALAGHIPDGHGDGPAYRQGLRSQVAVGYVHYPTPSP